MEMSYNLWKKELERFLLEKYGSIDAANDYNRTQKAMDAHMLQFSKGFVGGICEK